MQAEEIASLGCWEIDFQTDTMSLSAMMRRIFGWDENIVPSVTLVLDAVRATPEVLRKRAAG